MTRSEHRPTRRRKPSTISGGGRRPALQSPGELRRTCAHLLGIFAALVTGAWSLWSAASGAVGLSGPRRRAVTGPQRHDRQRRVPGTLAGTSPEAPGDGSSANLANPFLLGFCLCALSFSSFTLNSRTHFCSLSNTLNLAGNAALRLPRHAVGQPSQPRYPHDFATRHSHPFRRKGETPCSPS